MTADISAQDLTLQLITLMEKAAAEAVSILKMATECDFVDVQTEIEDQLIEIGASIIETCCLVDGDARARAERIVRRIEKALGRSIRWRKMSTHVCRSFEIRYFSKKLLSC